MNLQDLTDEGDGLYMLICHTWSCAQIEVIWQLLEAKMAGGIDKMRGQVYNAYRLSKHIKNLQECVMKQLRAFVLVVVVTALMAVGLQSSYASESPETTPATNWAAGSVVQISLSGDINMMCQVGGDFCNQLAEFTSFNVGGYLPVSLDKVEVVRIAGEVVTCDGDIIIPANPSNCH